MTGSTHHQALPTVAEFLAALGVVTSSPVHPDMAGTPVVSLTIPEGWREVPEELMPTAYRVWAQPPEPGSKWAQANWADNAVLLVGRLSGPVDPIAVMRCAFTDSRRMPDWYELGADTAEYDQCPSAEISGAYSINGLTFWSSTRYLLKPTDTGTYLVQSTIRHRLTQDERELPSPRRSESKTRLRHRNRKLPRRPAPPSARHNPIPPVSRSISDSAPIATVLASVSGW